MNIWTCNRVLAAVALLALTACSDAAGGLFSDSVNTASRRNVALAEAEMARGALRLVPPSGYCIDRRGLRQDFAVMARCDSLGAETAGGGAPLGFIAVSVAPLSGAFAQGAAGGLVGPDTVTLARSTAGAATILHLSGPTPQGTDPQHWKGVMPVGAHAVSFSAFGPAGGRLARAEGGALLASVAQRVQAMPAPQAAVIKAEQPAEKRQGIGGLLSGLFD